MRKYKYLTLLTLLFSLTPFIIYFVERKIGILTTADEWYAQGINHGPWREGAFEGLLVLYPVMILGFIALFKMFKSLLENEWRSVFLLFLLVAINITSFLAQLVFLGWTFD